MTDYEVAKNEKELFDKKALAELLDIDLEELTLPEEPEEHRSCGIIGTAGHVDHGKSTLTQALTGKFPATYSEELIRGITIKLGYSHLDIMICPESSLPEALVSNANPKCAKNRKPRHIRCYSILDHPGHEILISTMVSGASIIDYGLVVIAANEPCPMPQTREHVLALQIMGIKDIIVAQNKIELVSKEKAFENYKQIVDFFENNTEYGAPPIIPVSAALGINIDILLAAILKYFKPRKTSISGDSLMYIARTFDPNLPGTSPEKLIGGAIGGALKRGEIRVGDEIEIRPGYITEKNEAIPLVSEVVSIRTDGGHALDKATPHSLIGIATNLDPGLTKGDGLAGSVAGRPDRLPPVVKRIIIKDLTMLPKIVGTKVEMKNYPLRKGEVVLINTGTNVNLGTIESSDGGEAEVSLLRPLAMPKGEIVVISRQIEREYRLVGYGRLDY